MIKKYYTRQNYKIPVTSPSHIRFILAKYKETTRRG